MNLGAGTFSTRARASDASSEQRTCLLRVCCEPGSDVLDDLETFAAAYVKRRFRPGLAQAVGITTYELCTNAINYASVATDITYELWVTASAVQVEVANEAVPARIGQLRQMLERVRSDAQQTYLSQMRRSISGRFPRPVLGLARVAHEANMELDLELDNRRVKLIARCPR